MPLLEYICKNGHRFERLVHHSQTDLKLRCPICHTRAEWAPTQAQKPVLKTGCGGFYNPSDQ